MDSMILRILADNQPARRFYEPLGGRFVEERPTNIGGAEMPKAAYGWQNVSVLR